MSENCNHNCEGCQADCGSRKADFKQPANKYSHIKKVIGVVSGKGGVGKSLVTCSLAAAMAARPACRSANLPAPRVIPTPARRPRPAPRASMMGMILTCSARSNCKIQRKISI